MLARLRGTRSPGAASAGAVRMVATSATRDAANAAEFVRGVERRLGVDAGGPHRPRRGVRCPSPARPPTEAARGRGAGPYLVVDIGGGSTEFVLGGQPAGRPAARAGLRALSVDIGCVRLTERHLHGDPPTRAEIAAATRTSTAALDRGGRGHARGDGPDAGRPGRVGDHGGRRSRSGWPEYDPGPDPPRAHLRRVRSREQTGALLSQTRARAGRDRRHAPRPGGRDRRRRARAGPGHAAGSASPRCWSASTTSWTASPGRWRRAGELTAQCLITRCPQPGPEAPCRRAPAGRMTRPPPRPRWRTGPAAGPRAGRHGGRLAELTARESVCRACPRLVAWREEVARVKRRSHSRPSRTGAGPIPGWGSDQRTHPYPRAGAGRARRQPDRPDLHRRPQRRRAVRVAAPVRAGRRADSAPRRRRAAAARRPDGRGGALRAAGQQADARPSGTPARPGSPRSSAAAGRACASSSAWARSPGRRCGRCWARSGVPVPRPRPAFGHGAEAVAGWRRTAAAHHRLGCYHPSQQNTFTGRVTRHAGCGLPASPSAGGLGG